MSSTIDCDLQALYDFHLDVGNLKVITPHGTSVTLLDKGFVPFEGGIMRLRTVKFLIPTMWEVRIEKMSPPHLLVDVAVKSPFRRWKHSHIFTQNGALCELRDEVEYDIPFGFIGAAFKPLIHRELERMFRFRHEVTTSMLEEKPSKKRE